MTATAEAPALIGTSGDSLREAFGKALSALADEFPKLVVLDADIAGGTGVHHFRKSPSRSLSAIRHRRAEHDGGGRRACRRRA